MEGCSAHLFRLRTPFTLRVLRGSLAQGYNQTVTIFLQLISVPVLLSSWGVDGYGVWLILSAIPTYLALADLGFAQMAANEMTIEVGAGNRSSAVTVFQSVTVLVAVTGPLVVAGAALLVFALPFTDIFKLNTISLDTARAVILILSIQIAVSLFFNVIGAGLKASGQFALMVFLGATSRLLEQAAVLILASFGAGMVVASGAMLFVRAGVTCVAAFTLLRSAPWIFFGVGQARLKVIKRLFVPSLAFMCYTLGSLVNIQGVTLVVAAVFGPVVVTSFSVMRTLARLGPTVANIISYPLEPEYSAVFGSGQLGRYHLLIKRHAAVTMLLCVIYVVGMLSLSHWIIHIWTSDRVQPIEPLLTLIMIACTADMIWSSRQMPLVTMNKHKIAASTYLFISIGSLAAMDIGARKFGIDAIGIISVGVSLFMIVMTQFRLRRALVNLPATDHAL